MLNEALAEKRMTAAALGGDHSPSTGHSPGSSYLHDKRVTKEAHDEDHDFMMALKSLGGLRYVVVSVPRLHPTLVACIHLWWHASIFGGMNPLKSEL